MIWVILHWSDPPLKCSYCVGHAVLWLHACFCHVQPVVLFMLSSYSVSSWLSGGGQGAAWSIAYWVLECVMEQWSLTIAVSTSLLISANIPLSYIFLHLIKIQLNQHLISAVYVVVLFRLLFYILLWFIGDAECPDVTVVTGRKSLFWIRWLVPITSCYNSTTSYRDRLYSDVCYLHAGPPSDNWAEETQ